MRLEKPQWKGFPKIHLLFAFAYTKFEHNLYCKQQHERTKKWDHIASPHQNFNCNFAWNCPFYSSESLQSVYFIKQNMWTIFAISTDNRGIRSECSRILIDHLMCIYRAYHLYKSSVSDQFGMWRDLFSVLLTIWHIPRKRSTFSSSRGL